jgi:hypothetical protein
MGQHHDIKILPKYYRRVEDGTKTFEVRENDRDYQAGDTVSLHEFDPARADRNANDSAYYTGKILGPFTIGYVFNLDEKRVVFSLIVKVFRGSGYVEVPK